MKRETLKIKSDATPVEPNQTHHAFNKSIRRENCIAKKTFPLCKYVHAIKMLKHQHNKLL